MIIAEKQTLTQEMTRRLPVPVAASRPRHMRQVRPAALSVVVVGQSFFLLLLAIAYALARASYPARPLYWLGECGIVAVLVGAATSCPLGEEDGWGIAFSTGLTSYLAMVLYDPYYFSFVDEYQHLQTATEMLRTHSFFAVRNTVLQVSPQYPGLEIDADLAHRATGLPLVASAYVTDGIYHIVALLLVYGICRKLVGDARAAVIGVAVFTFSPQFQFVDSYFTYSCLAITLALAAVYGAIMSASSPRRGWWWPAVGILCGVGCVVTHHVTSFAVAALLVVVAAVSSLGGARTQARRLWVVALPVATCTLVWTLVIGTQTIAYLRAGIVGPRGGVGSTAPHYAAGVPLGFPALRRTPTASTPGGDVILEILGYLALALLVAVVELTRGRVWLRRWRREPVEAVLTVGALAVLGLGAVRVLVPGGPELASRTFVYVMLPAAFVVSRCYEEVRDRAALPGVVSGPLLAVALSMVIWCGTLAAGWPAWYARLPGPAEPAAWDRSVDPALLACARWVASHEPSDRYIAGDQLSTEIVAAVAAERVSLGATPSIFLARRATPALARLARSYGVNLVIVDAAAATQAPLDGSYFAEDPLSGRYRSGLPAEDIRKFDDWPGASVVYSNGRYSVVDLQGSQ